MYVKIKFIKVALGLVLWVTEADTLGMYSLGYLLTDDVGYGGGKEAIEWILDDRYERTCSNRTFMEKFDGNVGVGDLFTDDPWQAALVVRTPVMIDLLIEWDVVCSTNPNTVTIYYENEKFRIESKKGDENKITSVG